MRGRVNRAPAYSPVRSAWRLFATLCALAALVCMQPARAHDIPVDVVVQVLARAADGQVEALLRLPLKALRDVEYPVRGPGYLDLPRAGAPLREAAERWLPDLLGWRAGDRPLAAPSIVALRASLQSERLPSTWDAARALATGPPLAPDTEVPLEQVMLIALLRWPASPAQADASTLQLRPQTERLALRVTTALRVVGPDGAEAAFELHGGQDWIALNPGVGAVAGRFVADGVRHVLGGLDHLLFVLCLVLPVRRFGALLAVVTAFTVAHSVTLIGAAYGLAPAAGWFVPLIEWLIALSILWLALQNVLLPVARHRWAVAFAFGLVHGFGFSFALAEQLQFAGRHLLTALVSFNVGVELGQVLVLAVAVPVLGWLFAGRIPERAGIITGSALIAHAAWHWMAERAEPLRGLSWWPGQLF